MGQCHCSSIFGDSGSLVHSDLVGVGFDMDAGVGKESAYSSQNSCSYEDSKGVVDLPLRISAICCIRPISRDVGSLVCTDLGSVDADMRYGW